MALPTSLPPKRDTLLGPSGIGSTTTSPSVHSTAAVGGHALTVSSIVGQYLYLVVQVTRDLQPVVYAGWRLPEEHYDLSVSDVVLAQFEALAARKGRDMNNGTTNLSGDPAQWRDAVRDAMVPLDKLVQVRAPTPHRSHTSY
jgi:CDK inhibitor PHO81